MEDLLKPPGILAGISTLTTIASFLYLNNQDKKIQEDIEEFKKKLVLWVTSENQKTNQRIENLEKQFSELDKKEKTLLRRVNGLNVSEKRKNKEKPKHVRIKSPPEEIPEEVEEIDQELEDASIFDEDLHVSSMTEEDDENIDIEQLALMKSQKK